ncbi:hypothetical protein [Streptomyces parvulus]|uniref:hypothetical protein n=1 Tax=Streptomyces parvulus TaxID=146923 RepID=UPI0015F00272|nr:hypothetical protein [Streptomyces parvulus]
MTRRRPARLAALTLTAAAALTLSACGGDDNSADDKDKIAGADTGDSSPTASPTTSAPSTAGRPKIDLPSDLSYKFEWPKTGDKDKDAVLADSEQSIKAVDLAIVNQDALDKAYLTYYEGEAAASTQEFIQAYVKENARVTGAYRYYDAVVNVRAKDTASLVYCEDQSRAYDMYLKPKKVNKTPVTKNSYVLYNTQLARNGKGIWVVEKMLSQRGSDKCQP